MIALRRLAAALALIGMAAAPAVTPASVEQSIRAKGAKQTVADLTRRDQWDAVIDHMDKGVPAWIALAPKLAAGSDAGASEDLGISLALALPHSPAAVLAAIDPANGPVLGATRVCGRPFIDDEPKGYKMKATAALAGVHDQRLEARRQACLKVLRGS